VKKVVVVRLKSNTLHYSTLLRRREFLYNQIDSIEEVVLTTRFGLKNKMMKIKVGSQILLVSQLYVKNYNLLKTTLEQKLY
jgi:hypothetical protein